MARADEYRLELRVGLLVLVGLVALVGIILVSERFSFRDDYLVTAYLRDAGGLRAGSPVQLAGLPIGKVKSISTDSGEARYPVKVVLAIEENFRLPASSTLSVATAGIFGDAYLAFTGTGTPGAPAELLPMDGSAKVYATRGFLDTATQQSLDLLERLNDVLDPSTRNDAKRLVHATANLAEESTLLMRHLREQTAGIGATVEKMDALATGLDATQRRLSPQIETMVAQMMRVAVQAEEAIAATTRTLATMDRAAGSVDGVLTDNGPAIAALLEALGNTATALAAVANAAHEGDGLLGHLLRDRQLARDVSEAAMNMSQISDLLLTKPEVLIFGMSNEDQIKVRALRDRLRMRRTFQEGFTLPPVPEVPVPSLLEQAREHAQDGALAPQR